MVIKARHHFIVYPFFRFYAGWIIKRHFGRIEQNGVFYDRNLPVLLLVNHFSWWDGFFAMVLNVKVLKRKFHFMMLEDQLRKYSFFNRTGGYSIRKKSRSAVETINYTAELLHDRRNMVLLFPQGKIESAYTINFRFEPGIAHIIDKAGGEIQIIFMANLIDYFSSRKPGLFMHIMEYNHKNRDVNSIQEDYNLFYAKCIGENNLKAEL